MIGSRQYTSDHPSGGVQASSRSTKIACSKQVIFDIVEPWVHDSDGRPRLRRTSHGMGHYISPPRDCDSTVSPAIANFWQRQPFVRPLKDDRHENIKWDPWMKDPPEEQQAQKYGGQDS